MRFSTPWAAARRSAATPSAATATGGRSPRATYTTTVEFADGSSKQYARRERPHLVLNAAGDPAFLTNGVQESWDSDHSYTLVQQTTAAWP